MNAQVSVHTEDKEKNMDLWKAVFTTDPRAVKPITGKSYKGSSPKPYWLVEQATKMFGPCGIGWGVEVVDQGFKDCSQDEILHWATVRVWYVYNGQKGHIEQMGGTKASYRTNSNKLIVDEDAAKKSVTDGMVKCLSMIGFAGDIFSGRWDDSKYVEQANEHHQAISREEQLESEYQQALIDVQNAPNKAALKQIWTYFENTRFAQNIKNSITAKRDQMGWE
ncbi:hypothetical protein [uncultured Acinetobacter sp.]|uniref:hypothetical protein n=1 Tax=uncultured Acinetobacter sp. TaxID=165433 RepID=UPI0025863356|nr:hypothetical protein [uncultured Acinetobacter sp.]